MDPAERLLRLADSSRYNAPEVLQGTEPTFTSDVFSAGRVIEDILLLPSVQRLDNQGDEQNPAPHARLEGLAGQMTSLDPAERPPSAKEVLRELERGDSGTRPQATSKQKRKRSRRRTQGFGQHGILRRIRRPKTFSAALLLAVLCALAFQSWNWFRTRGAIASDSRASVISRELVAGEVEALEQWTQQNNPEPDAALQRWTEMEELLRGTDWQPFVESKAEAARVLLSQPRSKEARVALGIASESAARGEWVEALEAAIPWVSDLERSPRWEELKERILTGLHKNMGLLFVPEGEVLVRSGAKERALRVAPFLVEATPAARRGDEEDGTTPLAGVSLIQARRIARERGKRLPTLAEWTRMAEAAKVDDTWGRFLAARLRGLQGARFEWVEDVVSDNLSRAGCGTCVGGSRSGVSLTQPLRRWRGYGYPDVGLRLAMDLHPRQAKED
jgi:hypothetical protein